MNSFCRRDIEDNSLICYNCASLLPEEEDDRVTILDNFNKKVVLCNNTTCKKEFDIDNQGKIININKVFRLIIGDGTGNEDYYYCSSRRLLQAKQDFLLKKKKIILFQSTKKYDIDDFGSRYENDLDSTCYDIQRRMICAYCKKLIDLDDDENRKELWGGQPDAHSYIMHDGCTVLIFCDKDCVDLSYGLPSSF